LSDDNTIKISIRAFCCWLYYI